MTYSYGILTNSNLDFRSELAANGLSMYGLNFHPYSSNDIFDYSSSTASQPTQLEIDELALLSDPDFSNSYPFENTIFSSLCDHQAIALSSGSDADLLVANSLLNNCESYSILTIGLEEAGRLCDSFLSLSVDVSQLCIKQNYYNEEIIEIKDKHIKKLNTIKNISVSALYSGPEHVSTIKLQIHEFIESQLSLSEVILVRVNLASKTGLFFPSIDYLTDLKSLYGDRIALYLDGCQYRNLHLVNKNILSMFDFISLSFSKFLQVPTFGACLFLSSRFSSSSLYIERLVNPFFQLHAGHGDIKQIQIKHFGYTALSSGAALRCILGFYRIWNHTKRIGKDFDYFSLSKNISTFVSESCKNIRLLDFDCLHPNMSGIYSFNAQTDLPNSYTCQEIFRSLQSSKFKGKSIFLGQPVVPNNDLRILFRMSIGYRIMVTKTFDETVLEMRDVIGYIDKNLHDL